MASSSSKIVVSAYTLSFGFPKKFFTLSEINITGLPGRIVLMIARASMVTF